MKLNFIEKAVVKKVLKKLDGTDIATLLREYRVIWHPSGSPQGEGSQHAKRDWGELLTTEC